MPILSGGVYPARAPARRPPIHARRWGVDSDSEFESRIRIMNSSPSHNHIQSIYPSHLSEKTMNSRFSLRLAIRRFGPGGVAGGLAAAPGALQRSAVQAASAQLAALLGGAPCGSATRSPARSFWPASRGCARAPCGAESFPASSPPSPTRNAHAAPVSVGIRACDGNCCRAVCSAARVCRIVEND